MLLHTILQRCRCKGAQALCKASSAPPPPPPHPSFSVGDGISLTEWRCDIYQASVELKAANSRYELLGGEWHHNTCDTDRLGHASIPPLPPTHTHTSIGSTVSACRLSNFRYLLPQHFLAYLGLAQKSNADGCD